MSRSLSYLASTIVKEGLEHGMQYQAIRQKLTDYFSEVLKRKREGIAANGRLTAEAVDYYRQGANFGTLEFTLGLPDDPQLNSFFKWSALERKVGSKDHDTIRIEYERAYSSFCMKLLDYDQSLGVYNIEPAGSRDASASSIKPTPKATLREVAEKFVTEQQLGNKHWVPKTEQEKLQQFELLYEILGAETSIASVSSEEARKVKATVMGLPKNRNKLAATRGLKLEKTLTLEHLEALSVTSMNKYLQSFKGLFNWAKRQAYIENNVFDGMAIRAKKNSIELRDAFSHEELETIRCELVDNERGLITKVSQKWVTLIAMYTGARLGEIAALHLDDIKNDDGIDYFDINVIGENKRLKNAASKRKVPIHSKLIELGLLDYVGETRRDGFKRLFPNLPYSLKNGYGRNVGQWFNNSFLRKMGLKNKKLVFHSWRHTMMTELGQKDVSDPIIKAIVGHSIPDVMHKNYFKGYTLRQLADGLEKFDL